MTMTPEKAYLEKRKMRTFDTGATRDSDDEKLDFEGFLSPLVIRRYAEYLHKHRTQVDGKRRDSDNWQKGIPLSAYMKSLWRHLVALWTTHREILRKGRKEGEIRDLSREEALCAIIFNASGYLHELLGDTESAFKHTISEEGPRPLTPEKSAPDYIEGGIF